MFENELKNIAEGLDIAKQLTRIADSLEIIARRNQMEIDWLTEKNHALNIVPIADQIVVEEKPVQIAQEEPVKKYKPGDPAQKPKLEDIPTVTEEERPAVEALMSEGIPAKEAVAKVRTKAEIEKAEAEMTDDVPWMPEEKPKTKKKAAKKTEPKEEVAEEPEVTEAKIEKSKGFAKKKQPVITEPEPKAEMTCTDMTEDDEEEEVKPEPKPEPKKEKKPAVKPKVVIDDDDDDLADFF